MAAKCWPAADACPDIGAQLRRADDHPHAQRRRSLVCEETFAPILYIMDYETLDEAIALHNAVPQGLIKRDFHA